MSTDRPDRPVRLTGEGLVLREWQDADLPAMSRLFDEPAVALRTPLASPFDEAAAGAYLERLRASRAEGTRLHLVVTEDGAEPLGEVLVSIEHRSLGYAVGSAHRGRRLAARAVRVLTAYAHTELGLERVALEIEPDNAASVRTAEAAGYRPAGLAPRSVADKGRTYELLTWVHEAH